MQEKNYNQKGIALLSSILLGSVILVMIFSLTAIFLPKLTLSRQAEDTVGALYAAETGLEWCLYVINKDPTALQPVMNTSSQYKDVNEDPLDVLDCGANPLKVIGTNKGVTRAFELTF